MIRWHGHRWLWVSLAAALDALYCETYCLFSVKIAKFDTESKEMVFWTEENCWPSEPVFVPRPNGESEDDGKDAVQPHHITITWWNSFSSDETFFFFFKFLLQVWSCHQWSTPTRASHATSWSWTAKRSKKWVEHTLVPSCRRTCMDISSHMHKTPVSQGIPFFLVSLW